MAATGYHRPTDGTPLSTESVGAKGVPVATGGGAGLQLVLFVNAHSAVVLFDGALHCLVVVDRIPEANRFPVRLKEHLEHQLPPESRTKPQVPFRKAPSVPKDAFTSALYNAISTSPVLSAPADKARELARLTDAQRYTDFYHRTYRNSTVWVRMFHPGDAAGSVDFGVEVRMAVLPDRGCTGLSTLNALDPLPKQRRVTLADIHGQPCPTGLVPLESLEFRRTVPVMRPTSTLMRP